MTVNARKIFPRMWEDLRTALQRGLELAPVLVYLGTLTPRKSLRPVAALWLLVPNNHTAAGWPRSFLGVACGTSGQFRPV